MIRIGGVSLRDNFRDNPLDGSPIGVSMIYYFALPKVYKQELVLVAILLVNREVLAHLQGVLLREGRY